MSADDRHGLGVNPHGPAEIHFPDHHVDDEPPVAGALDDGGDAGWLQDNVVLTTVGIDIGSATSHLMFARLHLQRLARELSSRFVVVEREVLHRSPILLTPYRDDATIDVEALGAFIHRAYAEAGLAREAIDTGAVILTGVALQRANAAAVAGLFAEEGGRFVCASAGHGLEALLAAHGSGSVAASAASGETILNVDIGGGTSKLALAIGGDVAAVSAIAVGARLITFDARGLVA
ncbi:MAG: ethanolamine ammonia-lyase reactivating factor EutA, partial [Candidatus Limnocylindria bacterium]|nr:ethanolamine ammonia-lyase reactivating factor EutA [Candidatus Limnocylindria bacterium]